MDLKCIYIYVCMQDKQNKSLCHTYDPEHSYRLVVLQ